MNILIIIFGVLILLVGGVLIVNPQTIFNVLRDNADRLWLYIAAVAIRLLLGVLLVLQASVSKFPLTMEVLGWVAIIAAVVFVFIGRDNFKRLVSWAFTLVKPFGRIAGILGIFFGGFLIYAFV